MLHYHHRHEFHHADLHGLLQMLLDLPEFEVLCLPLVVPLQCHFMCFQIPSEQKGNFELCSPEFLGLVLSCRAITD
jgi:hypothetical protein